MPSFATPARELQKLERYKKRLDKKLAARSDQARKNKDRLRFLLGHALLNLILKKALGYTQVKRLVDALDSGNIRTDRQKAKLERDQLFVPKKLLELRPDLFDDTPTPPDEASAAPPERRPGRGVAGTAEDITRGL